jgi:cell wall assembly regulator SMI1
MAGNAKSITKVWSVIDAELAKRSPKAAATLRKPAVEKSLAALEKAVKVPLSEELRAYLAIHDGQDDKKPLPFVFTTVPWILLPAASIVSRFKQLKELEDDGEFEGNDATNRDGFVNAVWWSDKWIPFAVNAGGDYLCVDMGPTKKGRGGQLLWWYHDEDFRERQYEDLTTFFQKYADALAGGKLTVRPDGAIVGDL